MINHQQTERIKEFLRTEKFTDENLINDLVDHLSCEIESRLESSDITFEEAFELAKQKTLPIEPIQVQKDLEFLTTKTQNIMIKKTAYIGGYVSTLCLCLAILFFSQSLLGTKKTELKISAMELEFYKANFESSRTKEGREPLYDAMNDYSIQEKIDQSKKFERAELLFIISILTFGLTYLPYRFYASFKGSELQIS